MQGKTTVKQMIQGNKISVPNYQRAYSWDVGKNSAPREIEQFIIDIEEYQKSDSKAPYYFGHFLFEKKEGNQFAIIDGQQRLTTIIIAIAALYRTVNRDLTENEQKEKNILIGKKFDYHFSTVD